MEQLAKLKLLVTITDRPKGNTAAKICAGMGLQFHLGLLGRGTASSEVLRSEEHTSELQSHLT